VQLVVIAKEPRPGFVKTRLTPACSPQQAASIAAAALADTLSTVCATPADRRVLALDGRAGGWVPPGIEVIAQREGDLGNRLHGAFEDCFAGADGPVVVVGMDTPQMTCAHLARAMRAIGDPAGPDAVLAAAEDGGYWLIGLRWLHPDAFRDMPMSDATTGAAQHRQLVRCGYRVATVDALVDVDTAADARAVAATIPRSRFARAVHAASL
jgi:rSAM/selenodomain-associated transferase 1